MSDAASSDTVVSDYASNAASSFASTLQSAVVCAVTDITADVGSLVSKVGASVIDCVSSVDAFCTENPILVRSFRGAATAITVGRTVVGFAKNVVRSARAVHARSGVTDDLSHPEQTENEVL